MLHLAGLEGGVKFHCSQRGVQEIPKSWKTRCQDRLGVPQGCPRTTTRSMGDPQSRAPPPSYQLPFHISYTFSICGSTLGINCLTDTFKAQISSSTDFPYRLLLNRLFQTPCYKSLLYRLRLNGLLPADSSASFSPDSCPQTPPQQTHPYSFPLCGFLLYRLLPKDSSSYQLLGLVFCRALAAVSGCGNRLFAPAPHRTKCQLLGLLFGKALTGAPGCGNL